MKKDKKLIAGIVLIIIGVIGLFGLIGETADRASLAIGSIVVILIGVLLIFLAWKSSKKTQNVQSQVASEALNAYNQGINTVHQKSKEYEFKVVGVTFKNVGGTSRQTILRKIKYEQKPFDELVFFSLKVYDFEGRPAIGVYADDTQIGNVPRDEIDNILALKDKIISVRVDIIGGQMDEDGNQLNFGAVATIYYSDKETLN